MLDKFISGFKYMFDTYIRFCKSSYPLIKYGIKLLMGTPILVGGINLLLYVPMPENVKFELINISYGEISYISMFTTILTTILGAILIIVGLTMAKQKARKTSKVLITSMLTESMEFPDEILTDIEKKDARETVKLGLLEENDYIKKSIKMFNAEQEVNIYSRFIFNHDCKKIYLGGRARIPFLVAYGTRFRNAPEIEYFDQLHGNQKWELLNNINKNITINYNNIDDLQTNDDGDIALAICFTSIISEEQLDDKFKNHTLYIKPSVACERNLIRNKENLQKISSEIKSIIDKLSAKKNCRYIHMFLSVQTSLAIEIGRNYQEGMHKNFVVHNFSNNHYEWAIKINKNSIELF